MTDKVSFILYSAYSKHFSRLSDEEAGKLIKAIFQYVENGTTPELPPCADVIFTFISEQLDRDLAKWADIKKKRSEAVKKRWEKAKKSSGYKSMVCNTNDTVNENENVNENVNENENENVNENENAYENERANENENVTAANAKKEADASNARTPKSRQKEIFVKPTMTEVFLYCQERGNNVNAQRFVDYYESNGWKIGKNPMTDWKAAVRSWESNGYGSTTRSDYGRDTGRGDDELDYSCIVNRF